MTGGEILTRLYREGISYRLDGSEIVLTPAELVTVEIRAAILADRAAVVAALSVSTWCTGWRCIRFEEKTLPRQGLTGGCLIRHKDYETWRPLHRMTVCPLKER